MEGVAPGKRLVTKNLSKAEIDAVVNVHDQEAIEMMHYLQRYEGISVGPTAAMNLCGAVKMARKVGPGHTIVTILCDHGD